MFGGTPWVSGRRSPSPVLMQLLHFACKFVPWADGLPKPFKSPVTGGYFSHVTIIAIQKNIALDGNDVVNGGQLILSIPKAIHLLFCC
ncbi:unnamed protein product [Linum tenue]|uniref:Uncharacterized protein n=1 Tax=Linum tenue TaxID=586396 RepID=A0AAV0JQS7_9ROSI|nr:unnamed protein product [Linum tenue]